MRRLFGFLFAFLLIGCGNSLSDVDENLGSDLGAKVEAIVAGSGFNGVILIKQDTSTLYQNVWGFADLESRKPLQMQDQFVIGSISKQITAVLVLQAVERGEIGLQKKIADYINVTGQAWKSEVTIHQLLTHTHGVIDLSEPLAFTPGAEFQYSQLGYDLLARILAETTQKSFATLSTELFTRHGLTKTFHPETKTLDNLVKGYVSANNEEPVFAENSLRNYAAAGSFISTADDLALWNRLLHKGELVSTETLALMKTRYATREHPIFSEVEYGYGLLFQDDEADVQIGAFGYAPGFVSASYRYPKSNVDLVILENTGRHLEDFRQTFGTHIAVMDLIKSESINSSK